MSSPAQSLASVMKVPSNSCFPCLAAFCSFCFGSLGPYSASFRQHKKARARHISTISSPARNVQMLDNKKHQYFRSTRHSCPGTVALLMDESGSPAASSLVIPRWALPTAETSTHRVNLIGKDTAVALSGSELFRDLVCRAAGINTSCRPDSARRSRTPFLGPWPIRSKFKSVTTRAAVDTFLTNFFTCYWESLAVVYYGTHGGYDGCVRASPFRQFGTCWAKRKMMVKDMMK